MVTFSEVMCGNGKAWCSGGNVSLCIVMVKLGDVGSCNGIVLWGDVMV